ncbi:hypothetical protein GmHk_09G025771 [Glycine max]|nr:hypothetical protein GmHk_09G025771 [Glycine max]
MCYSGHSPSPPEELEAEVHKEEIPVSKSCYLILIRQVFEVLIFTLSLSQSAGLTSHSLSATFLS